MVGNMVVQFTDRWSGIAYTTVLLIRPLKCDRLRYKVKVHCNGLFDTHCSNTIGKGGSGNSREYMVIPSTLFIDTFMLLSICTTL